jgi:hypothetical protein
MLPFERLMYFLDQPEHPNCLGIRLRFSGAIVREAALAAAGSTFERHPGFQVTVDPQRVEFVDRAGPFRNFRWVDVPSLDQAPSLVPSDIHREGGGIFWFVAAENECEVTLIGHHALTDGIGGLQVISEWLLEYDRIIGGKKSRLPKLEPQRLTRRGNLDLLRWKFLKKLPFQPIALFGASKFLYRRFAPLIADSANASPDSPLETYPNILTQKLTAENTKRLGDYTIEQGCAVNDLLVSALFRAIAQWRGDHAQGSPRDWIRLLIPMSIRTIADRRLTACNRVSMVQIDRQPQQMDDWHRLLSNVARELRVIRQWQLDRTMLVALHAVSIIPGQLRRMARRSPRRATSLLTNLGDPFGRLDLAKDPSGISVGNLKCTGVEMIAPMLRGTPVTIAVAEFLGELTICMNYDPRIISREMAKTLLDAYLREIDQGVARPESVVKQG